MLWNGNEGTMRCSEQKPCLFNFLLYKLILWNKRQLILKNFIIRNNGKQIFKSKNQFIFQNWYAARDF